MEFIIYTASGVGKYYYDPDQDKPCKNAYLNGSKGVYPFSVDINTAQDFLDLMQECNNDIVVENKPQGCSICIYDGYIE